MKQRPGAMIVVAAAPGDDVDDCSRCLSELSLITGRQHLKLGNRLLIELRSRPAINGIFVWLSVNQEIVVAATFAQHRISVITAGVGLAVDGYAGHELQQAEVVSPVD